MHYMMAVHMIYSLTKLVNYFSSLLDSKFLFLVVFFHKFVAVSVSAKFTDKIYILLIMEVAVELD